MDKRGVAIETSVTLAVVGAVIALLKFSGMCNEEPNSIRDAIGKKDAGISDTLRKREEATAILGFNIKLEYIIEFGRLYKPEIMSAAMQYNLPPELILAVFYPELNAQNRFREFGDEIATYVPFWNPSIGLGQIRINTALELAQKFGKKLTRHEIIAALNTPEGAIQYVAMYLKGMIDRKNMGSESKMLFKPDRLIELYACYVGGATPNEDAMLDGIGILRPFGSREFLRVFGSLSKDEQECVMAAIESFREGMEADLIRIVESPSRKAVEILEKVETEGKLAGGEIKFCLERKARQHRDANTALFLAEESRRRKQAVDVLRVSGREIRPKMTLGTNKNL